MKLYIHFGVYKAGSSYIQHLCCIHRNELQQQGLYFPISQEDEKMRAGEISKGNIGSLDVALWRQEETETVLLFRKWLAEARERACSAVLLSGESLTHLIAIHRTLGLLNASAQKAGFKSVAAMGFFRPLVDHALSTYKHRAKSGKHSNFQQWVTDVYEAPVWLQRLLNRLQEKHKTSFTFRIFKKDSNWMKKCFFEDWLGLNQLPEGGTPSVNTSLTISEIKVMQIQRTAFPYTSDTLLSKLQSLPTKHKAADNGIEHRMRQVCAKYLQHHEELLRKLAFYFPKQEGHLFGTVESGESHYPERHCDIMLSTAQWRIIHSHIQWQGSLAAMWLIFRRKYLLPIYQQLGHRKQPDSVPLSELYKHGAKTAIADA